MSQTQEFEPLIVGKINGAYGIKGWVKIYSYTDPKENILNYSPLYMKLNGQWQKLDIVNGREQGKTVVAQFETCDDRNLAESYHGNEIAIDQSQLPRLDDNDFYWRDLVGLKVVNLTGEELGKNIKMMETGANDVLVVRNSKKEEILIPYVIDYSIIKVDLTAGVITVDWQADY